MQIACVYENDNLTDKYTVIFDNGRALALSEGPEFTDTQARWILVDDYNEITLGKKIEFRALPQDIQAYILRSAQSN